MEYDYDNDAGYWKDKYVRLAASLAVVDCVPLPMQNVLTPTQLRITAALLNRTCLHRESITALMPGHGCGNNAVSVHICHLRKKFKDFGVEINTNHSYGYWISDEHKKKIAGIMDTQ